VELFLEIFFIPSILICFWRLF